VKPLPEYVGELPNISGHESEVERVAVAARDKALFDKGVLADDALKLSETRLASATAERASALANVERTRIDLSRAKDALRRARVTSPLGGTVVAVGVEVGRLVSSGTGLSASPDAVARSSLSAATLICLAAANASVAIDSRHNKAPCASARASSTVTPLPFFHGWRV
jgi:multidrug efflux pump subunit AcrA (membrane-fusion protein)